MRSGKGRTDSMTLFMALSADARPHFTTIAALVSEFR
jgi:hypothetical protein